MPLHLVSVDEHSPAQRLGLEPGCTLLAIDGNPQIGRASCRERV